MCEVQTGMEKNTTSLKDGGQFEYSTDARPGESSMAASLVANDGFIYCSGS